MPMAAETMMMAAPKCASACTATLDLEVPHSSDASEAARVGARHTPTDHNVRHAPFSPVYGTPGDRKSVV